MKKLPIPYDNTIQLNLHLDTAKFVFAVEHSLFDVQPQD